MGGQYLDSGAMYRAVALRALRLSTGLDDADTLTALAADAAIELSVDLSGSHRVLLDGVDVTTEIRSPEVTAAVSAVSAVAGVRRAQVETQRGIGARTEKVGAVLVAEGRDMGSVVFPKAQIKIFLVASASARALRRAEDMASLGHDAVPAEIEKALWKRDKADSSRSESPLVKAPGAVEVDTTTLSPDAVLEQILELCREQRG